MDGTTFVPEMPHPARFAILERMIEVLGPGFEIPDPRVLEGLIVERLAEHPALAALLDALLAAGGPRPRLIPAR